VEPKMVYLCIKIPQTHPTKTKKQKKSKNKTKQNLCYLKVYFITPKEKDGKIDTILSICASRRSLK
jgi:hypothetical protein